MILMIIIMVMQETINQLTLSKFITIHQITLDHIRKQNIKLITMIGNMTQKRLKDKMVMVD